MLSCEGNSSAPGDANPQSPPSFISCSTPAFDPRQRRHSTFQSSENESFMKNRPGSTQHLTQANRKPCLHNHPRGLRGQRPAQGQSLVYPTHAHAGSSEKHHLLDHTMPALQELPMVASGTAERQSDAREETCVTSDVWQGRNTLVLEN